MTVTPEMIEAGNDAHGNGDDLATIYLAMRALDPEVEDKGKKAARASALDAEFKRLRDMLNDWRNSWLCPVGHFDGDRLVRETDSVLNIRPIAGEYDD